MKKTQCHYCTQDFPYFEDRYESFSDVQCTCCGGINRVFHEEDIVEGVDSPYSIVTSKEKEKLPSFVDAQIKHVGKVLIVHNPIKTA